MESCVDCAAFIEVATSSEVITCAVTVVSGLIIRFIEKRRMRREMRNR